MVIWEKVHELNELYHFTTYLYNKKYQEFV